MSNNMTLKFDWLRGGKCSFALPLGASVQMGSATYPQSGKFVDMSAGYGRHAVAASTYLTGWCEVGQWNYAAGTKIAYFLASATAGATVVNCIRDLTAVFRMPLCYTVALTTNWADTQIGLYADLLASTTGLQQCDLTTAVRNVLIGVGGLAATAVNATSTIGDGYVDVMMNPATSIGA